MRISDWSSDVCSSDLTMLYFMLFNIAPTVFELALVLGIFWVDFGLWLVASTVVMVAAYIVFTQKVTDWRNALRARMNDLDTGAVAHAVDSLLNFETVKYFGAEEREARRYDRAVEAYAAAAVKSENRSEEHTSELQSLMRISYAVFCLKN